MPVVVLDDLNPITEPFGYFVNADPGLGAERGERVAHDVRSDPRQPVFCDMIRKWSAKIVTVEAFPFFYFPWGDHEWGREAVTFQKVFESVG